MRQHQKTPHQSVSREHSSGYTGGVIPLTVKDEHRLLLERANRLVVHVRGCMRVAVVSEARVLCYKGRPKTLGHYIKIPAHHTRALMQN